MIKLLCFVCCIFMLISFSISQNYINVAKTSSKTGIYSSASAEMDDAFNFWLHYVNDIRGGVRWNSTSGAYDYKSMGFTELRAQC